MRQLRKPPNAPAGRNRVSAASQEKNSTSHWRRIWRYAGGLALLALLITGVSATSWHSPSGADSTQHPAAAATSHTAPWQGNSAVDLNLRIAQRDAVVRQQHAAIYTAFVNYAHAVHEQQVHDTLAAIALVRQRTTQAQTHANSQNYSTSSATSSGSGSPWDGVARCETGGNWQHQTRYDGGLGILHAAWVDFGGTQFAPYGSQATREQQITVAERIKARYGLSGWGCKAYYGK